MNKIRFSIPPFVLIAFLAMGIQVRAQQQDILQSDTLKINLEQALSIALSQSNTIKIANMTVEKTGYAQKGTYAALYPNINSNGSFQRTLKKQVMAMEMGGQSMEIEVGKDNNVNVGISASMPIVNAQLWQSLKLSATGVELAVEQARSSKISMISQVKQAFYAVLLTKESYNVMNEMYQNALRNYEETLKKYNVGKASEATMLRSKVSMMNAEPNVYNAEAGVVLAVWRLKALMGIDLNTNVDVIGNLADYTDYLGNSSANITGDLVNNSSLRQLELQGRQIEQTITMTKYQYIPTLSGSFSYNFMAMGNDSNMNWNPYSVAGLSLAIPIFDGFSKHSTLQQHLKTREILNLQKTDVERNLRITMKNYFDQLTLSSKNYAAAKESVTVAQKSYNISEKMYEIGKATIVELNDAQLALTQAQLTMYQAVYNYMVTKASLEELLGNEQ